MLVQPVPDLGRFVRSIVVEHQMHIPGFVHRAVDTAQELQELPCPMTRQAFANHETLRRRQHDLGPPGQLA